MFGRIQVLRGLFGGGQISKVALSFAETTIFETLSCYSWLLRLIYLTNFLGIHFLVSQMSAAKFDRGLQLFKINK